MSFPIKHCVFPSFFVCLPCRVNNSTCCTFREPRLSIPIDGWNHLTMISGDQMVEISRHGFPVWESPWSLKSPYFKRTAYECLSSRFSHILSWLVVWEHLDYFSHDIGTVIIPTDEVHHFSRWWLHHQPDSLYVTKKIAMFQRKSPPSQVCCNWRSRACNPFVPFRDKGIGWSWKPTRIPIGSIFWDIFGK